LFPQPRDERHAPPKIKVKLRRDPEHENPTYEQEQEQFYFYNDDAEDYVQFRSTLSINEKQAPLDTTATKVHGVSQSLYGRSQQQWEALMSDRDETDEEAFNTAMEELAINSIGAEAREDQYDFMEYHLHKPRRMSMSDFIIRGFKLCSRVAAEPERYCKPACIIRSL
jgi:hypothetical protein